MGEQIGREFAGDCRPIDACHPSAWKDVAFLFLRLKLWGSTRSGAEGTARTDKPCLTTRPGELRLNHFKKIIQVMFGDLAGSKASKHSLRRSFRPRHIHVAHPYQRDLPLILKPPVHRFSFCQSVALVGSKSLPTLLSFLDNLRFLHRELIFSCSSALAGSRKTLSRLIGARTSMRSA